MRGDVAAQIVLLLDHRLEQQPFLRGEVPVDRAERDVGGGRHIAHLHRLEATFRGQRQGRVEHRRRRAAWLRARAPGSVGSAAVVIRGIGTRFDFSRNAGEWDSSAVDVLELADGLFTGEIPIASHHPFASSGQLAELQPQLAFVDAFANSAAVDTDDGLVVVDTSGVFHAKAVHETMRRWSSARLDTAIFTHGHIDHVFGVDLYEEEARINGWSPPRVVAHEAIGARFDRYALDRGLQRGDQPAAVQSARFAVADGIPTAG